MYKKLDKKKIFKLIIILVLVEITCFFILHLIKVENKDNEEVIAEDRLLQVEKEENEYKYQYFDKIVNKFLGYVSELDENIDNEEALISILDNEYIKENSLNEENVLQYFEKYKNASEYVSKEVYSQKITYAQIYKGEYNCIKGVITKDGKDENIFFLIKQDYINSTFNISIITEKMFKKLKKTDNNNSLEIEIEENNYNKREAKINDLNL